MPRFEVPEALVMEILCKVPVKSLIRFNCLCKYWCSSFQTPRFISKHYHNNLKNNNLNPVLQRFDANANIPYFSQLSVEKDKNFLVKQNIRSPLFMHNTPMFGFDSKTDDYKFIRFVTLSFVDSECETSSGDGMSQVELYSLKCDSWKEIPSPNYRPFDLYLSNNYLDGIFYWQTTTGNAPYENFLILSFDTANEKFSASPIPEFVGIYPQHDILEVLVFNGSLGVIAYTVERIDMSFDLWVMNGEVWTKQFSIESIPGVVRPLGFWKNGEMFLLNTKYEVVLFDPSTQELKVLRIITYLDHHRDLIPINGIQEHKSHIIRQLIKDASNKH
ncbi:hypothetical protein ERO13_D10G240608v2 [Gossypium hirsutum]|nr:hypothetical protein ERO13_D10G240608v2 [Gossypium hirsutum]